MSYCRFGDDSDVYVYNSFSSLAIHVAKSRCIRELSSEDTMEEILASFKPIDLPHDGASFYPVSINACVNQLLILRNLGYKVPEYVITQLRQEEVEDVSST